jgi:predicted enzyme related to lactoylglutathione lyase
MTDIAFQILYVENVADSTAFYTRTLGRSAIDPSPTFAMIPAGPALMLGLWRRDEIAAPAGIAGGSEIAFMLENDAAVDAAFAEWQDHGAAVARPPARLVFGYTFLGLDPDGHRVRFFAPTNRE